MVDLLLLSYWHSRENETKFSIELNFPLHKFNEQEEQIPLCLKEKSDSSQEFFLILCENGVNFLNNFRNQEILSIVNRASSLGADILFLGAYSFESALYISENLFWVETCRAPNAAIITRQFLNKILAQNSLKRIRTLEELNKLTYNKFLINPFILDKDINSQSEFNNSLYSDAMERLATIKKINEYFFKDQSEEKEEFDVDCIVLPTYVINLESRPDRLKHIKNQFEDKPEFEIHMTRACEHPKGNYGLWQSICAIVKTAIANDDDIIIIVEDDHEFTDQYDKKSLINNIIQAGMQGAEILSGGTSGGFQYAIPITESRFWIDYFWATQFIVLYKNIFEKILNASFSEEDTADDFISNIATNKMVLYPFISVQKEFGYSDITRNEENRGDLSKIFINAQNNLAKYSFMNKKLSKNSSR